ncbi:MAG: imidazolonepropionase [Phycisphaerales bacterium]|nr:MAG: imidazolonepropionase [Phycisphaerales bacterium]
MLAIRNISELVVTGPGPIGGRSMGQVSRIKNAAVLIDGESISWFGPEAELAAPPGCETIDAQGGCVVPGLIDCHTHTVFAATRENEFVQRIEGKSYAEIAEAGGGIKVSVESVRCADCEDLVEQALPRLKRMLHNGVTTVEIKSGYGLSVDDELKMLEAIRRLKDLQPIEIVATYLAAHTIPKEFNGRPDAYLDAVLDESVLSRIRDEGLAEFCDVFCEQTAFDLAQSRRVLTTCQRFDLKPRLHADQITQMGATVLAGEVGAVSADHLETIDDAGLAALKEAGTVGVILPACSFFLGVEQAPARRLLEADLAVAIATDYNPGSSMVESLPLTMTVACTQARMTPAEVLVASTANAAAVLARHERVGAIQVRMQADLVVLDVPNHERWMYEPGRNCVRTVLKKGQLVATNAH